MNRSVLSALAWLILITAPGWAQQSGSDRVPSSEDISMWPRWLPMVGVTFGDQTNSHDVQGFATEMAVDSQGIAHITGQGSVPDPANAGSFVQAAIYANNRWETRQIHGF